MAAGDDYGRSAGRALRAGGHGALPRSGRALRHAGLRARPCGLHEQLLEDRPVIEPPAYPAHPSDREGYEDERAPSDGERGVVIIDYGI